MKPKSGSYSRRDIDRLSSRNRIHNGIINGFDNRYSNSRVKTFTREEIANYEGKEYVSISPPEVDFIL